MTESELRFELRELATLAIRVLDAQKGYFESRTREDLIASEQLEGQLRLRADKFA